jgi:4-methyl-5(b-hydroxyethyl)-thiazole monophosphate biosynthesis
MTKKILVVVPDGADDMEVVPFIEIPSWTKIIEDLERVDVKIAAWDNPAHMYHGMTIIPDMMIDDVKIDEYDAICIPGGWGGTKYFEQVHSKKFLEMVKQAHKKGKYIATACNGILTPGEAGVLKGKKATAYTSDVCEYCVEISERIEGYGAKFTEQALVESGGIFSSIGPSVGDEDAFNLIEKLIGEEAARKIADTMMYNAVKPKELKYTFPTASRPICIAPKKTK